MELARRAVSQRFTVPSTLHLLSDPPVVIYTATGIVGGAETIAAARDVQQLTTVAHISGLLIDFSKALELSATTQELRTLAEISVAISQHSRGASLAIAASQEHVFGAARMWEVFAENILWHVELFRDSTSAGRWLGLSHTVHLGDPIGTYGWPAA